MNQPYKIYAYDVQSFITRTRKLIQLEHDEELSYDQSIKSQLTIHQLQQLGIILTNQYISESYTGLYGRQLIVCGNRKGLNNKLKSNVFSVRDIVILLSGNNLTNNLSTASNIICTGTIYKLTDSTVTIAIDREHDTVDIDSLPSNLCVIKQPNDITYKRYNTICDRLQQIVNGTYKYQITCQNILNVLYYSIAPTKSIIPYLWQPYSASLNNAQIEAITNCLSSNDIQLIHGPPGTGKTTTVCELIYQYTLRKQRVLVCAPSNIAVDNIVEKLIDSYSISCIRLGHPARLLPSILSHSLDSVVARSDISQSCDGIRKDIKQQQNKLFKSNDKSERYSIRGDIRELQRDLQGREKRAVSDEIKHSNVICCTLTGAASKQLQQYKYDVCIIDEAAQALEIACLIPFVDCSRLVLAGDHMQLGPTIKSDVASTQGLQITLFDRLIQQYNNSIATLLNIQYRMNQNIMNWSSQTFYNNQLIAHDTVANHLLSDMPNIQNNDITNCSIMLIDTSGCNLYEVEKDTDSNNIHDLVSDRKSNIHEAEIVQKHVARLTDCGVAASDIAVIAPYNAQVSILRDLLLDAYNGIEIGTVDGLQGREKQCVIISMTRSNNKHDIGFLSESRRMNVAVTRAKRHVCIIGDSDTVSTDNVLHGLMNYIELHGEVYSAVEYLDDTYHNANDQSIDHTNDDTNTVAVNTGESNVIDSILNNNHKPVIKRKPRNKKQPQSNDHVNLSSPTSSLSISTNTITNSKHNNIDVHELIVPELTESDIDQICQQLIVCIKSGELNVQHKFNSSLDGNQRKLIHSVAERYNELSHDSVGMGHKRHIVLKYNKQQTSNTHQSYESQPTAPPTSKSTVGLASNASVQSYTDRHNARMKAIDAMEKRAHASIPQLIDRTSTTGTFGILDNDDMKDHNNQHHDQSAVHTNTSESIKSVQQPTTSTKSNATTCIHTNETTADDDIDTIMNELRVGQCHYSGCTTKLGIMGMTCSYCNESYCTKHYAPIVHSDNCMRLYGQHARNNDMKSYQSTVRNGILQPGTTQKKSTDRSAIQAKLEKAKQNVAHKTAQNKTKTKK